MRLIAKTGKDDLATVYILELESEGIVECVESLQSPFLREDKWVLIVSTLFGCPIGCIMCDAGGFYRGKLSKDEIFGQIDFLVLSRYPSMKIPCRQFKIQFARMGEPSLNRAVLDVLGELPDRYDCPGLMPSISTVAPSSAEGFFERLLEIKRNRYANGKFQLQFSIHTTNPELRDKIIPVKKWSLEEIAEYGDKFFAPGDRKVTLNFALIDDAPIDSKMISEHFDPGRFLIKITPVNPTYMAMENRLNSYLDPQKPYNPDRKLDDLRDAGYEVIISIGEIEENLIGSNCGQYIRTHMEALEPISGSYSYKLHNEQVSAAHIREGEAPAEPW